MLSSQSPNYKSPGPDGLNGGFYKVTWQKVGLPVCAAMKEIFSKGIFPNHISETKLILLPKVPHPQFVSEFRPISYCNVIYKTISKLIGQRVKQVLPFLIDQSQGAFIKGRELFYNVLICQDLARVYLRKNISPRCILKIDLQKAFDSIHWGFLKEWLKASKFPMVFIKWIIACLTSVKFSIHLNG